jgi:PAS domain S-box-containing protein
LIIRPGWPTASAGGGRRDGGPNGLLAALVDQLAIGVVAVDAQRRITLWNAEAERLTGFSTDEAVGALATELGVAPQDRAQAQQQAARLLAGESWVGEFPVRRKDGRIVTMRFRATGVTDPDGLPVAVVGAFDDATQAQRREEALAQLDALFEATTLGLAYFDTDLRYRRVNAAVTEMAGGTVADRVGRSMADVHGEPVGTAVVTALREVLATGQPRRNVRISGRLFHGRGAHQEWSVDFYPVRAADQRLLGVGAALRDVTTEQRTLDRYQSLVTATSAAVWTRDAEGRAVEDSPSFRAVTGQDFDVTFGLQSTLIAPVFSERRVVAALAFAACRDRPHYTPEDLAFVTELAARASTAVEHGRAFQRTREAALTLQMAMLTDPPTLPPLEIEVRYQPAAAPELEVGGDWYDAFMLPGGELAIAVGDVAGHDLAAATAMGQLRSMLRALAFSAGTRSTPARVLKRLDYRATTLEITRFTSVLYGRLHHDQRTGQVHFRRHEDAVTLPAAATLVLYTDGLVERPGISLDEGISALLALADASADLPLKDFCDRLLHDAPGTGDDIALLAVRLPRAG